MLYLCAVHLLNGMLYYIINYIVLYYKTLPARPPAWIFPNQKLISLLPWPKHNFSDKELLHQNVQHLSNIHWLWYKPLLLQHQQQSQCESTRWLVLGSQMHYKGIIMLFVFEGIQYSILCSTCICAHFCRCTTNSTERNSKPAIPSFHSKHTR